MLQVDNLTVAIGGKRVVDNVSFHLYSGKTTALVGESGSGKTLTALAILDLLPEGSRRLGGKIIYKGENILELARQEMRQIRGNRISIVFQEPFSALNPVINIRTQMAEALIVHKKFLIEEISDRIERLFDMVKLSQNVLRQYPHELSGGMCQRVNLAMALALAPDILILDEPTTALDVSIQKEVLDLIKEIQNRSGIAILFITHDFSIVNMVADEICVMKEGVLVEKGSKEAILKNPQHPYTQRLINCIPRLGDKRKRLPV